MKSKKYTEFNRLAHILSGELKKAVYVRGEDSEPLEQLCEYNDEELIQLLAMFVTFYGQSAINEKFENSNKTLLDYALDREDRLQTDASVSNSLRELGANCAQELQIINHIKIEDRHCETYLFLKKIPFIGPLIISLEKNKNQNFRVFG